MPDNKVVEDILKNLELELKRSGAFPVQTIKWTYASITSSYRIVWTYPYGTELDIPNAEKLLNERLKAVDKRLGNKLTNLGTSSLSIMWDICDPQIPLAADIENKIRYLDQLDWEAGTVEGGKLLRNGEINVLISWLAAGKLRGIPAGMLRKSENSMAAAAVMELLKSPSSDIRERAALALGPLGGEEAARLLCDLLPKASSKEVRQFADALGRLAWQDACPSLRDKLETTEETWPHSCLAEALVRCGDRENGLDILHEGLYNNSGPEHYLERLNSLDKDGLADSRLLDEMKTIRKPNPSFLMIAGEILKRHGIQ